MESSSTTPMCCSSQLSAPADDTRTTEDVQRYLRNLNDKTFLQLIPVVTFLLINIVIGVLGNLIVFFVYLTQFKPSATRVFVLEMAVCDFVTSVLIMPWDIHDIMYSYTRSVLSCRITWFFGKFPTIVSYLTLICVAFDRRRRICQVHERQLSARQATYLLSLPLTLTSAIVFPFIHFYGVIPVETEISGIRGSMCGFPKYSSKMNVKQILGILLLTLYIVELVVLTTCYLQISYRIYQQKKRVSLAGEVKFSDVSHLPKGGKEKKTEVNSSQNVQTEEISDETFVMTSKGVNVSRNLSEHSSGFKEDADGHDAQDMGSQAETHSSRMSSDNEGESHKRVLPRSGLGAPSNPRARALFSRTTFMMLLITVSTVICCIPYFALT